MTNGEKHIEKLLSWYKEAVTEDGVCYLTSDDKNTLAYAIKCCKHFEDIKKDIDSWMLRNNPSSSEKPNRSEIQTGSITKNDLAHNLCDSCTNIGCEFQSGIVRTECAFYMPPHIEPDNCGNYVVRNSTYLGRKDDLDDESEDI